VLFTIARLIPSKSRCAGGLFLGIIDLLHTSRGIPQYFLRRGAVVAGGAFAVAAARVFPHLQAHTPSFGDALSSHHGQPAQNQYFFGDDRNGSVIILGLVMHLGRGRMDSPLFR